MSITTPFAHLKLGKHFKGSDKSFMEALVHYVDIVLNDEPHTIEDSYPTNLVLCRIERFYMVCETRMWVDLPDELTCDNRFKLYFKDYAIILLLLEHTPDHFWKDDPAFETYKEKIRLLVMEQRLKGT